jgi:hypothetical protein
LKGDHVFALPYASCLSTFRAPGWGMPAVLPPCRWRNATPRELVPFSHRSASRIFIVQPGCTPSPAVTQDGDHQPLDGEKQAGPRSPPSLSFKDAYHPCEGGERGEPGLYLHTGRLATSSSSFWWWKPSSSSVEEASSSHAGEGGLLLSS